MALLRIASWIFLTVFLLGDLVPKVFGQNSWSVQKLQLKQGEEGSATCTIMGLGAFDVVRLFKKNGGKKEVISDNGSMKSIFANTPRYSVYYSRAPPTSDTATITVTYKGVRGEDAGRIGCLILGEPEATAAFLNVRVQVPVESVKIQQVHLKKRTNKEAGSTLHMKEGEERGLVCTAKRDGTHAAPQMIIFVNGKDESDLFTRAEQDPETVPSENGGMPIFRNEEEMSYVTATPSAAWNEANLTCVATAPGFPSVSYSVMVDVEFKPIIHCPQFEVYAQLGESALITCTVESNPGPTIGWQYGDDHTRAEDIEEMDEDGNMRSYQRALNGDKSEIKLEIELLDESHFTNYYLTAENDIDLTEVTIKLSQGKNQVVPDPGNSIEDKDQNPKYNTGENIRGNPSPQESKSGNGETSVFQFSLLLIGLCLCSAWNHL